MAQGAMAGPEHARLERAVADPTVDKPILRPLRSRRGPPMTAAPAHRFRGRRNTYSAHQARDIPNRSRGRSPHRTSPYKGC